MIRSSHLTGWRQLRLAHRTLTQKAINESRLRVWRTQQDEFFEHALIDADGTIVATLECIRTGLYRAIKTATDTPVRYVQYPDEGHGNRMSTNRYDYLVRTPRWLEHYLRGGDQRQAAPPPIDLDYSGWR